MSSDGSTARADAPLTPPTFGDLGMAAACDITPESAGSTSEEARQPRRIDPNLIYLTNDVNIPDRAAVAELANSQLLVNDPKGFFAPLYDAINAARKEKNLPPVAVGKLTHEAAWEAAGQVIYGTKDHPISTLVARLSKPDGVDQFLGCIRFEQKKVEMPYVRRGTSERIKRTAIELSYFFDPQNQNKGAGYASVLLAMHAVINIKSAKAYVYEGLSSGERENIPFYATVHPGNVASQKILYALGFDPRGFSPAWEGIYTDQSGNPDSRLKFFATKKGIDEFLATAAKAGKYSPSGKVYLVPQFT